MITLVSRSRYPEDQREGWGIIRPGDRKAHYYRDMDSLCQRVWFYSGPLEPDESHGPDDCKGCRKVLDREYAKAGHRETDPDEVRPTDPAEAAKEQIRDFHRNR